MYIHLGRDYVLNDRDIIGIFNLETTTISPRGREFLNYAQKNGAVVSLSDELPQSYVLADALIFLMHFFRKQFLIQFPIFCSCKFCCLQFIITWHSIAVLTIPFAISIMYLQYDTLYYPHPFSAG